MKQSIGYAFLLNIVILFIFICFSIIMGIMSYYKAFRANTIIVSTIEKYEGYNCASKAEIEKKLNNISYKLPFRIKCKSNESNCMVDSSGNYKITAYNLDGPQTGTFINNDILSIGNTGTIYDGTNQTRNYQYGVTTYMYVNMPVINKIMRLSFFSKTDIMYEFRNIKFDSKGYYDSRELPEGISTRKDHRDKTAAIYAGLSSNVEELVTLKNIRFDIKDSEYSARERSKWDINSDGNISAIDASNLFTKKEEYGQCKNKKSFSNY